MIAEASTWGQQRRLHDRRRSATRLKTNEALRDELAVRDRLALDSSLQASVAPAPAPPARVLVVPSVTAGEAPVVRKAWPTFADVLRTFDSDYRRLHAADLTVPHDKVLRELAACYTPLLGTHEWTCGDCGTKVVLPNGCHNRHCCTCGSAKRTRWAQATCAQILPVQYCHLILTVPQPITQLAMLNPRVVYPLVMRVGAESVLRCGRELFQVELALLSLLHTWGQLVNDHLHSHSMLPAGGLRVNALEWIDLSREQIEPLLERVRQVFPQRFCQALRQAYDQGQLQFQGDAERRHLESPAAFKRWLEPLENMPWIIRCPEVWDRRRANHGLEETIKVIEYLANYANRIALSDSRILDIVGDWVLFSYKDYRDGDQQKTKWIEGVALIHRFLRHLLPAKMHHIRRYGWLGRRTKQEQLQWLRQYHGLANDEPAAPQEKTDKAELALEEQERTQTCRFCTGRMQQTGSTLRPRVSEVMNLPLSCLRQAQAGVRVTLGQQLPQILAERSGHEPLPFSPDRAEDIRRQLNSLLTSGYL